MEQIIIFLEELNRDIVLNNNISLDDLKKLLLITYNELISDNDDPLIKSFLIVTLKHFVDLENKFLSSNEVQSIEKENNFSNEDFIKYFTSNGAKNLVKILFKESK